MPETVPIYAPFLKFPKTQEYGATGFANEPAGHGFQNWHNGLDYAAPTGTPIYPFQPGLLTVGNDPKGYGNYVKVQHGDGTSELFGHLSQIFGKSGDVVTPGTVVGLTGSSGNSTGAHVHFSVFDKAGADYNPLDFLAKFGKNGAVQTTPEEFLNSLGKNGSVPPTNTTGKPTFTPAVNAHKTAGKLAMPNLPGVPKLPGLPELPGLPGWPDWLSNPNWAMLLVALIGIALVIVGLFLAARGPQIVQTQIKEAKDAAIKGAVAA